MTAMPLFHEYLGDWTSHEVAQGFKTSQLSGPSNWKERLRSLKSGASFTQRIFDVNGVYKLENVQESAISLNSTGFLDMTTSMPHDLSEPITALESSLTRHAKSRITSQQYIAYGTNTIQRSTASNMPQSHMLRDQQAVLSLTESFTSLQKQKMNLQSVSVLWCGHPVIWLIVPPRHASKLEAWVAKEMEPSPTCSQFVAHTGCVPAPSKLSQWGIDFKVIYQPPGGIVKTDYGVYCFKWHTGVSLAECVGTCETHWLPPPLYRVCCDNCDSGVGADWYPQVFDGPTPGSFGVDSQPFDMFSETFQFLPLDGDRTLPSSQHSDEAESMALEDLIIFPNRSNPLSPEEIFNLPDQTENLSQHSKFATQVDDPLRPSEWFTPQALENLSFLSPSGTDWMRTFDLSNEIEVSLDSSILDLSSTDPDVRGPAKEPEPNSQDLLAPLRLEGGTPAPLVSVPHVLPHRAASGGGSGQANSSTPKGSSSPPNSGEQEIERLIALACKHEKSLRWKSGCPMDANAVLSTFKPSEMLTANAITETLHVLTSEHENFLVTKSTQLHPTLREAASNRAWERSGVVLMLPIYDDYFFLVSIDVGNRIVTIHDNRQRDNLVESLSFLGSENDPWDLQYKQTRRCDPDPGIALLEEAEQLIRAEPGQVGELEVSKLRYLRDVVDSLTRELRLFAGEETPPEWPATSPTENRATKLQDTKYLEHLASAIGCAEVIRDFMTMVKGHRTTFPENSAMSKLQSMVLMYEHGDMNTYLGTLQKDLSSITITQKFETVLTEIRKEMSDGRRTIRRQKRRESRHNPLQMTIDRSSPVTFLNAMIPKGRDIGRVASAKAWDRLVEEWNEPGLDPTTLRARLQRIKYRGDLLLAYQDACGTGYDLWPVLPARTMPCPQAPEIMVKPSMYRDLKKDEIKTVVESVKSCRPKLWACLPELGVQVGNFLRNQTFTFTFLQEALEEAQNINQT